MQAVGAGGTRHIDREAVRRARAAGESVWIDLVAPPPDEVAALTDLFGFHPLAVEDAQSFGQRPKIEDYDDHVFVVAYGYDDGHDLLVEVHCFLGEGVVVTVREAEVAALSDLAARASRPVSGLAGAMALHAVLDALTDSLLALVADIDEEIASFDDRALAADRTLQGAILSLRRRLVRDSRIVSAQGDVVARLANGLVRVPGLDRDAERYFRDVHDHLLRIGASLEGNREMLTGVTGVLLAASSNAVGDVTKQLTVIATVFLPLSFVVGFFGQNFSWMIDHIGGPGPFLVLGVGLQLAVVAGLIALFRRRRWI